ncbi:antibiotic biosynthesis monooxygenase [Streptomyces kaniharaensis]|uniref:antibiotic biosynthesis monooxygenase n=1 Tax=Streptomyces kaniharaensis TaxID=212423 RepID=UPI001E6544C9|nr:antibiotic biosynthesis monooxygenase [Streptomyces kaniharaensis]
MTGGRGPVKSPADWPVPGLISHTAGPTPTGWFVVDVWESEEAFQRFGEIIIPILRELGVPNVQPKVYPVFAMVTG